MRQEDVKMKIYVPGKLTGRDEQEVLHNLVPRTPMSCLSQAAGAAGAYAGGGVEGTSAGHGAASWASACRDRSAVVPGVDGIQTRIEEAGPSGQSALTYLHVDIALTHAMSPSTQGGQPHLAPRLRNASGVRSQPERQG